MLIFIGKIILTGLEDMVDIHVSNINVKDWSILPYGAALCGQ
jgi:hypothetical protein